MPTVKLSLKQLAQRALETPSLTQGYQFKPVDGVVEVLDGWTASVGLAFAHDKIRSPVIHDIVQQRCRDVAFIVESIEFGEDVSSSLLAALNVQNRMVKLEPIRDSNQDVSILAHAPRRIETSYSEVKDLFTTLRLFGRTFVLPSSYAFFINRFAILRQPHLSFPEELDVLMQLFLYWCVMESSYHLPPKYQYSEQKWSEMIRTHRDDKVYGEASFVAMRSWWMKNIEGRDGRLGEAIVLRILGDNPGRGEQHKLEDRFRSMVRSLTTFFNNVDQWLNHLDKTAASSSNVHGSGRSPFQVDARPRPRGSHPDRAQEKPVVLDY